MLSSEPVAKLPPMPTATAPARNQSPILCSSTPPVGIIGMCGSGPRSAFKYDGPNAEPGNFEPELEPEH